jgi:hypothetical protein
MLRNIKMISLQAGIAGAALVFLAGANDEGCGEETVPPPPPVCEEGFHTETVCEPACDPVYEGEDAPDAPCDVMNCYDTCVPDEQCPEGTYPEWVCYDAEPAYDCGPDEDCGPPEPPSCYLECVPSDTCGEGFHEEWICGGDPGMPEPAEDADERDEPLPPEDCYLTCVPDGCPPGTIEQTICTDIVPSDDPMIPPEEECWTECVPEESCPPGTHPEEICEVHPDCMEPVCRIVCVDDCYHECDPTLACGEALTCIDGLLYPTTCGPANCDEPIGLCDPGCDPMLACDTVLTCFDGLLYPTGCGPANCDKPIGDCGE